MRILTPPLTLFINGGPKEPTIRPDRPPHPEFSSQIRRLLAASPIQKLSFLYICSVFVHVVALFFGTNVSQFVNSSPKHSRQPPRSGRTRIQPFRSRVVEGVGRRSREEDECQFINRSRLNGAGSHVLDPGAGRMSLIARFDCHS